MEVKYLETLWYFSKITLLCDLVQSAAAKHKTLWYLSKKLLLVGSDVMLHV
jgi:hypothetical protein